ncbi:putative T7SS-secreted protein [Streptomyces cavernicola]|uniref:Putative T7SS secretion signal domain-containing protein n=1 Tax=Streptomyces cavernicola TaxID=3043613 RepID=A0ABT6SBU7_9ACTN|nr:hypothetical protein [Streptomyces sp. B-S-A6]MDI3405404.1 hypothetical protein [Streptomyces sp. B-S-A6]
MGLGDYLDAGAAALGDGAQWVGDKAADGLEAIGADGAAEGVRDAGEWTGDKLGADIPERGLGETEDPKELIHGNVETITERAEHLRDFYRAFERLGTGLRGLDSDSWRGEAGDAFREKFSPQPKFWLSAADACEEAAKALVTYASTVQWAQAEAREAIAAYKQAKAASDKAVADYNTKVDRYNRVAEAGGDPGPEPGPFTDPGKAGFEQAEHQLKDARRQRDDAARTARETVKRLVDQAPPNPGALEVLGSAAKDMAEGMVLNQVHFVGGALKGLAETAALVRMVTRLTLTT